MKKLMDKIGAVPHLFSKLIVLWCVLFGSAACAYSLRILSRTGHDPAALLSVILAFVGGELLMLCLRKVLSEKTQTQRPAEECSAVDAAGYEAGFNKDWEKTEETV